MVERRKVFIRLRAENDRSHSAVLTAIVRAIYSSLSNVGNANFNGYTSRRTSFILFKSLPCKVLLANVHEIFLI